MILAVDASVALRWVLPEPGTAVSLRRLPSARKTFTPY